MDKPAREPPSGISKPGLKRLAVIGAVKHGQANGSTRYQDRPAKGSCTKPRRP